MIVDACRLACCSGDGSGDGSGSIICSFTMFLVLDAGHGSDCTRALTHRAIMPQSIRGLEEVLGIMITFVINIMTTGLAILDEDASCDDHLYHLP